VFRLSCDEVGIERLDVRSVADEEGAGSVGGGDALGAMTAVVMEGCESAEEERGKNEAGDPGHGQIQRVEVPGGKGDCVVPDGCLRFRLPA
jgi:hypothetical protein